MRNKSGQFAYGIPKIGAFDGYGKYHRVKIASLSKTALLHALNNGGLAIKIGGFHVCLATPIPDLADHLSKLYGQFEIIDKSVEFVDFYTSLIPTPGLRRFFRPQVNFSFDGYFPFKPIPYNQASALFEWGLNWCVASHSQQFLIIHAAVVERNGRAVIFPGTPGSGKSTLSAALVCKGWRLLSDEMALLSLADGLVYPMPRPISLKNRSIDVIRQFHAEAVFGKVVNDTLKGTVGHLRPPDSSVSLATTPAQPAVVVFPKYEAQSATVLQPLSKGRALIKLAENSFNYNILGVHGFQALARLIDASACYDFKYSCLDEAIALFTELTD